MAHINRNIKRFLLSLFYRRLWVQIAVMLIVMVTISLALLGTLLIGTSEDAVRNSVLLEHKEIVKRAAEEIGLFIKSPQELLSTTAAMFTITDADPWKHETILVELILNQPIFMRVSTSDLLGKEIATSELGRETKRVYPEHILREIRNKKRYISSVKILDNHTPYITMAVPIKKIEKTRGMLIADVNLRGVWEIVDNIRLGNTGRAFLVSDKGILIAHQDKKRVLKNEDLSDNEDVKRVLSGRIGAIELRDKENKGWISAYAPIPGFEAGLILKQEQDETYAFSKIMKRDSQIIITLSIAGAFLISIFIARAIVRPLKELASRIKRVASGDLDHKIGVRRRDIIGELMRSFNDMTERLKRARAREWLSAVGEASQGISHELKNSLVFFKSFVQLFQHRNRDREFIDRFSRLLPEEVERWERLLKELSDFSSHSELITTNVDMSGLIGQTIEVMKERFAESKIDVKFTAKEKNLDIIADPERLRQVFINLFTNAINAMPEGGVLTVSAGIKSDNLCSNNPDYLEVAIKDTGKGIPANELEKIFNPFHTTRKHGMGLGLAISRKIIEQHNGYIEAMSKGSIGAGTTFIVKLPMKTKKRLD
ncbi:MAG: ATP-binding protein [Candidatus Omnitrophota bacterium]